jgi:two-component system sensor histidine kinase ResE
MKLTIRLWQTTLFIAVALVATLILYIELLPSIQQSISIVSRTQVERDVTELARHILQDLPLKASNPQLVDHIKEHILIFQEDAWVFNSKGDLILSRQSLTQPGEFLERAVDEGLRGQEFARADLNQGLVIASRPLIESGQLAGVVIVANNGAESRSTLNAARNELQIAFLVAVLASAILGFVFSELIARQVRKLTQGALAIAQGNFNLRLRRGLVPDEVGELAQTFNLMAEKLRDAFDAIRNQQKQILTVISTMGEGVLEVTAEGMINLVNPAASYLLDQPIDRLIGSQLEDIVPPAAFSNCFKRALSGKEFSGVCEYHDRVLLVHANPILRDSGEVTQGVVLILRDFTQQKKMEQAQRDFISNASHELRTPIASLNGFLELLENGAKDKPEVRDGFLKTMKLEIGRLQRLVEDLFTLTQLDSGISIMELGEYQTDDIIHEVIAVTSPLAASKGVDLRIELPQLLSPVVCDRDRIIQVLIGFVDNALKHTQSGGTITVFARPYRRTIQVGVADTGRGIPPDKVEKIFDRFYRYGPSDGERKSGGLGLSIAQEIVRAHASKIKVKSILNQGSTFSFNLKISPR